MKDNNKPQHHINKKLAGEMALPYTVPLGVSIGRNSGSWMTKL